MEGWYLPAGISRCPALLIPIISVCVCVCVCKSLAYPVQASSCLKGQYLMPKIVLFSSRPLSLRQLEVSHDYRIARPPPKRRDNKLSDVESSCLLGSKRWFISEKWGNPNQMRILTPFSLAISQLNWFGIMRRLAGVFSLSWLDRRDLISWPFGWVILNFHLMHCVSTQP